MCERLTDGGTRCLDGNFLHMIAGARCVTFCKAHFDDAWKTVLSLLCHRLRIVEEPDVMCVPWRIHIDDNTIECHASGQQFTLHTKRDVMPDLDFSELLMELDGLPHKEWHHVTYRAHFVPTNPESSTFHLLGEWEGRPVELPWLFERDAPTDLYLLTEFADVLSVEEFCDGLAAGVKQEYVNITHNGQTAPFHVEYLDTVIIITMAYEPRCFKFKLKVDSSKLSYLLLVESREVCALSRVPHLGTWLLSLLDAINIALDIPKCSLYNASTFETKSGDKINADCAYARTHGGLGYYMSKGWLVKGEDDDTPEDFVVSTNQAIQDLYVFWAEHSGEMPEDVCDPSPTNNEMVKRYDVRTRIVLGEPTRIEIY